MPIVRTPSTTGAIALVSFNPNTNPPTIFHSKKISSIDYVAGGNYRINFSEAISNYVVSAIGSYRYNVDFFVPWGSISYKESTSVTLTMYAHTNTFINPLIVDVGIFQ